MKTKMNNTRTIFNLKSMGRTTRSILRMSMMILALFIISCDGEDGMDGIDGIAGTAGTNGTDGAQGPAGEDGNANVIASEWIEADFDPDPTTFTDFFVAAPELTIENRDSAAILIYARDAGFPSFSIPPTVYPLAITIGAKDYYYTIGAQGINFIARTNNGNTQTFNNFEDVRYVVIPSSSLSGKNSNLNYKKMTYEEVVDHFGLEH